MGKIRERTTGSFPCTCNSMLQTQAPAVHPGCTQSGLERAVSVESFVPIGVSGTFSYRRKAFAATFERFRVCAWCGSLCLVSTVRRQHRVSIRQGQPHISKMVRSGDDGSGMRGED